MAMYGGKTSRMIVISERRNRFLLRRVRATDIGSAVKRGCRPAEAAFKLIMACREEVTQAKRKYRNTRGLK